MAHGDFALAPFAVPAACDAFCSSRFLGRRCQSGYERPDARRKMLRLRDDVDERGGDRVHRAPRQERAARAHDLRREGESRCRAMGEDERG